MLLCHWLMGMNVTSGTLCSRRAWHATGHHALPTSSASSQLQRFEFLLLFLTSGQVKRGLMRLSRDDFPVSQDWSLLTIFVDLCCGCQVNTVMGVISDSLYCVLR